MVNDRESAVLDALIEAEHLVRNAAPTYQVLAVLNRALNAVGQWTGNPEAAKAAATTFAAEIAKSEPVKKATKKVAAKVEHVVDDVIDGVEKAIKHEAPKPAPKAAK